MCPSPPRWPTTRTTRRTPPGASTPARLRQVGPISYHSHRPT
ncbi:hypothetical protein T261_6184 [Streptomyces lydicus]|nr:hypothetical protein T261_6184 [Streptomyces lydicus]